jgi:hypothetical protein
MIKSPELSASASWLARLSRSFIAQNDICICFANKENKRVEVDGAAARRAFAARKFSTAPC